MCDAWAEDHPVLWLASGNPSVWGRGWKLLHSIPVIKGVGFLHCFPNFGAEGEVNWSSSRSISSLQHVKICDCLNTLSNIKRLMNAYTDWCMLTHLDSKHAAQTGLTGRWSNWVIHLLWFPSLQVHITKEYGEKGIIFTLVFSFLKMGCNCRKWKTVIIEALILAATLQIFTFFCWFCCPSSAASSLCIPLWWHHDGKGAS